MGKFLGADPGNAGASLGDPQSWNGYGYVSGNPLTFTDPSGLIAEAGGDGGSGWGGIIVGAIEAIGEGLAGLFGSGGSHTDLSNVAWTPSWSVTTWGISPVDAISSQTGGLTWASSTVETIPGLVFFAEATASGGSNSTCTVSARDRRYLDLYYGPVSQAALGYQVSADFHGNDHRFQLKAINDFILGDHHRSEATLAF